MMMFDFKSKLDAIKKKLRTPLFIALAIFALVAFLFIRGAWGFDVHVENTSEYLLFYELTWIDCDWYTPPEPCLQAGGEMKPGQTWDQKNRHAGFYQIEWSGLRKDQDNFEHRVFHEEVPEKGILKVTPDGAIFLPGT